MLPQKHKTKEQIARANLVKNATANYNRAVAGDVNAQIIVANTGLSNLKTARDRRLGVYLTLNLVDWFLRCPDIMQHCDRKSLINIVSGPSFMLEDLTLWNQQRASHNLPLLTLKQVTDTLDACKLIINS